jgi:hypothetical protein
LQEYAPVPVSALAWFEREHWNSSQVPLQPVDPGRLTFFTIRALYKATNEFLLHYHGERAHQGLDHQILQPGPEVGQKVGAIACQERMGGLLKNYHWQAA